MYLWPCVAKWLHDEWVHDEWKRGMVALAEKVLQFWVQNLGQKGMVTFDQKLSWKSCGNVPKRVWSHGRSHQPTLVSKRQSLRAGVSVRTRCVRRLNSGRKGYGNFYPERYGHITVGKVW